MPINIPPKQNQTHRGQTYSWKVEMKEGKEWEFGVSRGKLLYRDKDKQGGPTVPTEPTVL